VYYLHPKQTRCRLYVYIRFLGLISPFKKHLSEGLFFRPPDDPISVLACSHGNHRCYTGLPTFRISLIVPRCQRTLRCDVSQCA
jgi:hypothetical protein